MKNRIPLILLLNIAGVALFCSWYLPANHGAWLPVDSAIFHFFNHGVSVSHAYAWLLAIINNRAFDACSLLAMGCLMLSYWLKAPTAGRRCFLAILPASATSLTSPLRMRRRTASLAIMG